MGINGVKVECCPCTQSHKKKTKRKNNKISIRTMRHDVTTNAQLYSITRIKQLYFHIKLNVRNVQEEIKSLINSRML